MASSFLKKILKSKNGQSIVEYILLMSVLMSILAAVFNSRYFKDFLGDDSAFFEALRKRYEYTYRHGRFGNEDQTPDPSGVRGQPHESYNGRFFTPLSPYPTQN